MAQLIWFQAFIFNSFCQNSWNLRCYISKNGETHNTKISMEFGNDVDPASGSWEGPKKPSSTFLSGPVPKLQPIDWFRSPKWPFLGVFGESWKMLLFCNGLTYMAQTFRDDSLGQNPTFLLSKCFYFMTPGGAAAFVYFLTKQPVWRCLKDLISNFFGFSESLGKSTLYTLISKWDL